MRHEALQTAWAGQAQWRILDTAFDRAAGFLRAWHLWRCDLQRPARLHYVAIAPLSAPAGQPPFDAAPGLADLARELAGRCWGLTPGLHRLAFEGGRLLLTLCVGRTPDMLRELSFAADQVRLAHTHTLEPAAWRALARLCRRGTQVSAVQPLAADREQLRACGFVQGPDSPDAPDSLHWVYDPAWTPRAERAATRLEQSAAPGRCIVVGAGLAGAAVAASLARRGWQVEVIDAAPKPASGASGLPAGLLAPHLSPDDNLLSRLSRSGIRITLDAAAEYLREGLDWSAKGTLEHRLKPGARAAHGEGLAADWSRAATTQQVQSAGLPPQAPCVWHGHAGWIRPAALVQAWLAQPGIRFHGGLRAERLERGADGWRLMDGSGQLLVQAPMVILAAALDSAALAGGGLRLHAVRGQVSWGPRTEGATLPAFAVNGSGHLLPDVPIDGIASWITGSTYGPGETDTAVRAADHAANFERMQQLIPTAAAPLAPTFVAGQVQGWAGVRCASTDRRPLVGELEPGLWVSTAMGSRGLTFAALCAELLVARLHGEPLPLPASMAAALDLKRQKKTLR